MTMRIMDSYDDLEALAREELIRLQRRYRLMEGDKHEYAQQSGTTISRAHRIMEYLRNEKEDLLTDFSNATAECHKVHDKNCQRMVSSQLSCFDRYHQEMKDKIALILEEESQVDKITDRIIKQKLKLSAAFGQAISEKSYEKKFKDLENTLYHVTTWFDSRCSKNTALREEINLLLMEREYFHRRQVSMKKQITNIKAKMLLSVYQATQTYDSRDEDVAKMKAIRERDEKESRQHVLEIKELDRILHHDEKDHHFIQTKNIHRELIENDLERLRRLEGMKELHVEQLLAAYKKSVKQILQLAGIQDVDKLCNSYMEQEQRNFVRFQYISNLNNECEVIKDAISDLKHDIETAAAFSDAKQLNQLQILKTTKEDLIGNKRYLKVLYEDLDQSIDRMHKILTAIEEVFHVAECNNSPVIQILGNFNGLHARNLKLCLEILERTIMSLVKEKNGLIMRTKVEIEGRPITKQMLQPGIGTKVVSSGGPFKPKVMLTGGLNPAGEEDEKQMTNKPLYLRDLYPIVIEQMEIGGLITPLHDEDNSLLPSESILLANSSHHIESSHTHDLHNQLHIHSHNRHHSYVPNHSDISQDVSETGSSKESRKKAKRSIIPRGNRKSVISETKKKSMIPDILAGNRKSMIPDIPTENRKSMIPDIPTENRKSMIPVENRKSMIPDILAGNRKSMIPDIPAENKTSLISAENTLTKESTIPSQNAEDMIPHTAQESRKSDIPETTEKQ